MPIKIKGATSGSVTIKAPDTGTDQEVELIGALANKAAYPSGGSDGQALVKSGTTTAWATIASGLNLVGSASPSAVTSVTFNNVFTSTYRNYRILIDLPTVASYGSLTFRMRASGSDDSSANYDQFWIVDVSNYMKSQYASNQTSGKFGLVYSTKGDSFALDIFAPQLAARTYVAGVSTYDNGGVLGMSAVKTTTQYDGITVIAPGNMTGAIHIYGYAAS